jgi:hypothetical protein
MDTDGREKRFEALVSEVFSHEGTQRKMEVGFAVRKAGCLLRFAWIGVHSRFLFTVSHGSLKSGEHEVSHHTG